MKTPARLSRLAMRLATLLSCTAILASAAVVAFDAPNAWAEPNYGVMNATGGIYWRSAPDWNTPIARAGYGFYPGTVITVHCYQSGTAVPGSADTMWVQASWAAGPGTGSGWINEHFVNDGAPINQPAPGVRPCGSTPPPPPATTSAPAKAVAWANSQLGSAGYQGLCLKFVFDAWSNAGVNLRGWVNVPIGSNTYPIDSWGHFTHGTTGTGTPPPGALVFYASRTGNRTLSHVTLSTGGGNTISSSDALGTAIHNETISQHSYASYLGWWLPTT